MEYVLPSYSNIVRYFLRGSLGDKQISEPINWKEDEKEFKRSTTVHGVFTNLSNNLKFYKGDKDNDGGYDYLRQIYELEGINATVILIKQELDSNNNWVESYRGYLDFSTYSTQNNIAEIKFNESGVYEKIKARQSEKLELGRLTTMDGDEIEELETQTVELKGREILFVSSLKRTDDGAGVIEFGDGNKIANSKNLSALTFDHKDLGDYEAIAMPMSMVSEVSGDVQSVYDYDVPENESSYGDGKNTGNMFYSIADDNFDLIIDFDIEIETTEPGFLSDRIRVDLVKYGNGLDYNFINYTSLIDVSDPTSFTKYTYKASGDIINLLAGQSLALVAHSKRNDGREIIIFVHKCSLTIRDRSFFDSSTAKFVLPHETLDRILHITTNEQNLLKSDALGRTDLLYEEDGIASLTGITNGLWVRKFDDESLTTSFKDFIESFSSVWQLGYGIEKINQKNVVRVEKIDYFYKDLVTIKIDSPKNIKRSVAKDYFYSGIEIGYKKPDGDNLYEETMGLDEYNIKSTFTTPITRVENVFNSESVYRADSYGKEFARRKPITNYPEEDTRYDNDVMLMDLKRNPAGVGNFLERKWDDDFIVPSPFSPFETGVYSPETATNLRLSPLNTLLRWGFWLKGGLNKYLDKNITYSSTIGNSNLITQSNEPGSKKYAENGSILINDLDKALFNPQYIEFEYPVSSELLRTVNGYIDVDGEKVMNYYGMVEFINEDGNYEYGFLMELKPNGKGAWKLLKANRSNVRKSDNPITPLPPITTEDSFTYELNAEING